MEKVNLFELLETPLRSAINSPDTKREINQFEGFEKKRSNLFVSINPNILEELKKALRHDIRIIEIFDDKMMVTSCGGADFVNLDILAKWLVSKSQDNGIEATISILNNYIGLDYTLTKRILVLEGIKVTEIINISESINLVPFDSLPVSYGKELLVPHLSKQIILNPNYFKYEDIAKSALVKEVKVTPKTVDHNALEIPGEDYDELNNVILNETCDFLTLFEGSTAHQIAFWSELDDTVPCKDMIGNHVSCPDQTHILRKSIEINKGTWSNKQDLYRNYIKMNKKEKELLTIPIQRLNLSRRQENEVNQAIELGIAYEAFFLNDKDTTDQISFTLRLRVSRFLGSNYDERKKLMRFITKFYGARSQAVHTGKLGCKNILPEIGINSNQNLLHEADRYLIIAISKVIVNGRFPDWERIILE